MISKVLTLLAVLIFASAPLSQSASDNTEVLNALGYTTGQSILLTHLALGTLADAFVANAYKADQTTDILATYVKATEGLKTQLIKILSANTLSTADAEFIKRSLMVADLVLEEAGAFRTYVGNKNSGTAQAYEKARGKALAEIKTLLGIND